MYNIEIHFEFFYKFSSSIHKQRPKINIIERKSFFSLINFTLTSRYPTNKKVNELKQ